MPKEMLINTVAGQECRIAIVSGAGLEEYYVERASRASRVGNIYKGRVTNVEAAIQAAFVDFGLPKNGFLHISDVHPQYFPKGQKGTEPVGRKRPHRDRPPIQDCLRRGQEVVVQMTKEGIGTKGPTLTSYLSIPGRLLVMMPGMTRLGVSRKIEDEDARSKARELLGQLKLPDKMGFIVRTAGLNRSRRDLQRDLNYLLRLWKQVKQRIRRAKAPAEIYRESDLVIRTVRDVYDGTIDRIICDSAAVGKRVDEFLSVAMPRTQHRIEVYTGKEGLFHECGIEEELERIYDRRVELPSGGSLVIDQTEALVAIDVNSGRFREHSDAETTAMKMNVKAAKEIGRQLRLRDLGGVIVIDFIDMRQEKNRRAVERALREAIRPDRAKTKLLRISRLGIVEMTRQRVGPSRESSFYRNCAHCGGSGMIKSEESQALLVLRDLQRATSHDDVAEIEVTVTPSVEHHLANYQRRRIAQLEHDTGIAVTIRADAQLAGDEINIVCRNSRGNTVAWEKGPKPSSRKSRLATVPMDSVGEAEIEAEAAAVPVGQDTAEKPAQGQAPGEQQPKPKKSRRRSRRGGRKHKKRSADQDSGKGEQDRGAGQGEAKQPPAKNQVAKDAGAHPPSEAQAEAGERPKHAEQQAAAQGDKPAKRRPRRRRRKKKPASAEQGEQGQPPASAQGEPPARDQPAGEPQPSGPQASAGDEGEARPGQRSSKKTEAPPQQPPEAEAADKKPKKRRRRSRKKPAQPSDANAEQTQGQTPPKPPASEAAEEGGSRPT